ncbi:MAG: signal peptidase I [Coriobacteriaceae bacterium]|nr:signal peptidase I [Coriobacteriaceae bacterium]MCI6547679.1 signal peptidase I [Coriobacteriaceae bacterium]MCI6844362.1 signal peptidase I [Coriobacteriaceae bacterium]MCI7439095.1 signal peptidase I [Coriobacteriaceae bacterium]MDD7584083.1 signal peptidase I [Coriobacteriaceae bacterium]
MGKGAAREKRGGLIDVIVTILGALGVAFLLRTFVVGVYTVPSGSMLETIQEGDLLLGEKVSLRWESPKAGDIVTFESPREPGTILVKRVVAVAGQAVDVRDGGVYVDGVQLDESAYTLGKPSYSLSDQAGSAGVSYPYTVPEGCIWVMGDNRTNSLDSRYFGAVRVDSVLSKILCIYWPISDARAL